MPMNPSFPDWYRTAGLVPQSDLLERRWAAIEELASKPTARLVAELSRLFVLSSTHETPDLDTFRNAFKKHDPVFSARDNLQELRVLAGATLRALVEQDGSSACLAALGIACGSFGPRGSALPEPEHLDAAQKFLVRHAAKTRKTHQPTQIVIPSNTKTKVSKVLMETHFQSPETIREPLMTVLGEILSSLGTLADQAQKAISTLAQVAAVREEEVSVLWWLHSQVSSTSNKTFSEVGYVSGAILFPAELAALTSFVPGPEYLPAVLVRALQEAGAPSTSEGITLAAAVNSLERGLRQRVAAMRTGVVPDELVPIVLAISKSLDTDGPEDWFPVYRHVCDVPVDRPFRVFSIALQLYRELMLGRASSEAQ